ANANWRWLEAHTAILPLSLALPRDGSSIAARMAMIAMTTSNSISVKPPGLRSVLPESINAKFDSLERVRSRGTGQSCPAGRNCLKPYSHGPGTSNAQPVARKAWVFRVTPSHRFSPICDKHGQMELETIGCDRGLALRRKGLPPGIGLPRLPGPIRCRCRAPCSNRLDSPEGCRRSARPFDL